MSYKKTQEFNGYRLESTDFWRGCFFKDYRKEVLRSICFFETWQGEDFMVIWERIYQGVDLGCSVILKGRCP